MTKYVLHGGFSREDNELNRTFWEEIAKDVPDNGTILLVYFASRTDDNNDKFKEDSESLTEQGHSKHFNFVFATEEEFLSQLRHADAVYFRGGSTNKLLRILRTYPNFIPLLKGKTVVGSSAGAYALAQFGASHSENKVREGLGMVAARVVCHWESPTLPPSAEAVAALEQTAQQLPLVFLRDYEWKVFYD